jgi:hypothetical protein
MAKLKNSVSYEVLTGWRLRLRRKCVTASPLELTRVEAAAV